MTLELERLAEALPRVVETAQRERKRGTQRLARARAALEAAADVDAIAARVKEADTSWLLAVPLEPPATRHREPEPGPYTVLAVDGSHADLDRFAATACAIINLGGWRIRYGAEAEAEPLSKLALLAGDDLAFGDRDDASRTDFARGAPLGSLRTAEELRFLAEQAREALADTSNHPLVGLVDGNLVLWSLTANGSEVRRRILDDGILQALDDLRALTERLPLTFAGYISRPGSTEVVNMLRVQPGVCYRPEGQAVDCGRCEQRSADGARPCDSVAVTDTWLFERILRPGERSAAFRSVTKNHNAIQRTAYEPRGHEPAFCYLHTGDEVARLEFPAWLATQPDKLDLLHGAVLDQCRRNGGYPVALQEAHERAVLTTGDRMAFATLVERALEAEGIVAGMAGKQMSKRVRGL